MDVPAPNGSAAAQAWPSLSADDLSRLRFLAYLHRTGRIRPPAPIRPEVDALCTALFCEPSAPRSAIGGLPPLWQTWTGNQKQGGAQAR